jgi:hypothetical protein
MSCRHAGRELAPLCHLGEMAAIVLSLSPRPRPLACRLLAQYRLEAHPPGAPACALRVAYPRWTAWAPGEDGGHVEVTVRLAVAVLPFADVPRFAALCAEHGLSLLEGEMRLRDVLTGGQATYDAAEVVRALAGARAVRTYVVHSDGPAPVVADAVRQMPL